MCVLHFRFYFFYLARMNLFSFVPRRIKMVFVLTWWFSFISFNFHRCVRLSTIVRAEYHENRRLSSCVINGLVFHRFITNSVSNMYENLRVFFLDLCAEFLFGWQIYQLSQFYYSLIRVDCLDVKYQNLIRDEERNDWMWNFIISYGISMRV